MYLVIKFSSGAYDPICLDSKGKIFFGYLEPKIRCSIQTIRHKLITFFLDTVLFYTTIKLFAFKLNLVYLSSLGSPVKVKQSGHVTTLSSHANRFTNIKQNKISFDL